MYLHTLPLSFYLWETDSHESLQHVGDGRRFEQLLWLDFKLQYHLYPPLPQLPPSVLQKERFSHTPTFPLIKVPVSQQ